MSESPDQSRVSATRQRMRPPPVRNGWALIVIAVSLVIFMALTLWWTSDWTPDGEARITDREVMHQLSKRMRQEWPQVPGPPDVYRTQAQRASSLGDVARAHQRHVMALALDPDHLDSWVALVSLSAQREGEGVLTAEESSAVLLEVSALAPDHPGLSVAMGWVALAQGDAARALSSAGDHPKNLAGRLLRLQALGESATLTDGEAVLELAPAHGPTCRWTASKAFDDGLVQRAIDLLMRCVQAGADKETGEMLAQMSQKGASKSGENTPKTLDSTPSAP